MNAYPLTLLYDKSCPICKLEMDNLNARNDQNLLRFIDVSDINFDTAQVGIPKEEMMRSIHAIKPDGSIVTGVEVLRLAYSAVGLGWISSATTWPILKPLCEWAYKYLARNRYQLSVRFSALIYLMAARRALRKSRLCSGASCKLKT